MGGFVVRDVVSAQERARIRLLLEQGRSYRQIMALVGRSSGTITSVVKSCGGPAPPGDWLPAPGRLSLADREEISVALAAGQTLTAIAVRLGRATSTISREVSHNGGRDRYRAWQAHGAACRAARRPKQAKLAGCARLAGQVEAWLDELWSPQQIARRLRAEFPHDPMMWVSHETIYQSIYVQGRGALRKELAACLRNGRAVRRPHGRVEHRGQIPNMVMISQRPAEVDDRAVPGHWEGDLIIGKNSKSAVGTLVERATRYVMLLHLPADHGAQAVREAMTAAIQTLPAHLARSITWDQGREMAQHLRFSVDTGVQVYFCAPHSPWQRGSNENPNGLLRQYLPKGTDLAVHSADDLNRIAHSLNNRPRQTLGWMKPSEKLAELLASTG